MSDEIRDLTTYRLASEADVTGPDTPTSPGAMFLHHVRVAFLDALNYARGEDADLDVKDWISDASHEIADGAVPIYTGEKWATFVDLAAYNEDLDDLGGASGHMDDDSNLALYSIAQRLAYTLADMVSDLEAVRTVHANGVVEVLDFTSYANRGAVSECGTCGRMWDDTIATGITPVPSGRCPFEYDHEDEDD